MAKYSYEFKRIVVDEYLSGQYECQPESDPRARLILSHLCSFESEPFKPRLLNGQADKSSRSCRVHMT